jgi:RimJ/RimL family protein N-acetyltransferase
MHVTRLELTVMCKNYAAKHLYEKRGFVVEGVKVQSMLVDDEYMDEYYMSKLF